MITQGTTPQLVFTLDYDISLMDLIYITLEQGAIQIEFTNADMIFDYIANTITISLTQAQSLQFANDCNIQMQIKTKFTDGNVDASNIVNIYIDEILKDEVI